MQERYSSLHEEKQQPSPLFFDPFENSRLCKACKRDLSQRGRAPLPFVTFAFHRLSGGFAVMPSQKGLLSVRAYQGTGLVRASLSAGGRADCKSDTARFMKRNSSLVLCFLIPLRIQDFAKHAKEIYHKEQDFLHLSPNISLRYHAAVRSKGASSGIKVRSPLVAGCPLTSLLVFNFPTKTTSIR